MSARKGQKKRPRYAKVFITPASGVGGEWPMPVRFDLTQNTRDFVKAYARACEKRGQKTRIVWP